MTLRIYNSLTKRLEDFTPMFQKRVYYYTCGPSVYNFAHIGNFRTFFWEDILHRYLLLKGYQVIRAMPISDLEDKAVKNYLQELESVQENSRLLTFREFIDVRAKKFISDFNELDMLTPNYLIKFSDMVEDAKSTIEKLLRLGYAYTKIINNKNYVFFDVSKVQNYGHLWDINKNKKGFRIKDDYSKSGYYDFCLWKETMHSNNDIEFDFTYGRGRPGNGIYCSLIATKYLNHRIDIHAGGTDNRYPHHENEIAICYALTKKVFANYWFHVSHVTINKRKMSKRLGNIIYLDDLKEKGFTAEDLRFFYSLVHYRKNQNFTFELLKEAKELRNDILSSYYSVMQETYSGSENNMNGFVIQKFNELNKNNNNKYLLEFLRILDDDLNLPGLVFKIKEYLDSEEHRKNDQLIYAISQILNGLKIII
ncbi:MAG: class I tRNA ligase family protein [Candidatus Micrarchaeota archaeon]|nr:class I tRNA ligase family protein [Candidatus Micrarchaeota archaeon]